MIELRFHRELYSGKAIDEALKVFGTYVTCEQAEEPSYWIVRLTGLPGSDAAREKRIAGELSNFALGLTIKSQPPSGAS